MRVSFVSIALAVVVAGCGSDEASVSTTTSADTSPTSASEASTTSLPEAITSSTPSATATTTPELDVELVDGEVLGPDVFEVELGETLDIWIRSDVDDEVHVHGYDLSYALGAGEPLHLSFVADVPGIFEVEAHTRQAVLFVVEVSG